VIIVQVGADYSAEWRIVCIQGNAPIFQACGWQVHMLSAIVNLPHFDGRMTVKTR